MTQKKTLNVQKVTEIATVFLHIGIRLDAEEAREKISEIEELDEGIQERYR